MTSEELPRYFAVSLRFDQPIAPYVAEIEQVLRRINRFARALMPESDIEAINLLFRWAEVNNDSIAFELRMKPMSPEQQTKSLRSLHQFCQLQTRAGTLLTFNDNKGEEIVVRIIESSIGLKTGAANQAEMARCA